MQDENSVSIKARVLIKVTQVLFPQTTGNV